MKARKPLQRSGRLRPISKKRQRGRKAFDAVYAQVDERAGHYCEIQGCREAGTERHHLFKPRRGTCEQCGRGHFYGHHRVENILKCCEAHHDEFESDYANGRRMPTTFNTATNRYETELRIAASKWAAREGA